MPNLSPCEILNHHPLLLKISLRAASVSLSFPFDDKATSSYFGVFDICTAIVNRCDTHSLKDDLFM